MSDSIKLYEYDSFKQLLSELKRADVLTAKALNNAVAEVAAKGRRKETEYENTVLVPREETSKWRKGKTINGGTLFTPHGYNRAKGNPELRLINFSWENKANARQSFARKFAKVAVSSQQMNLWGQRTKPYSTQSPPFSSGAGMGTGIWKKGQSRPARLSMTRFRSNIEAGMSTAMQVVNTRWQAEINKMQGAKA